MLARRSFRNLASQAAARQLVRLALTTVRSGADGVETGFGDLLGEFIVAFHRVEDGLMVHAELCGRLATGEARGHEAQNAAFGQVVKLWGLAAAEGARGDGFGS
jgi:hypothetical protein